MNHELRIEHRFEAPPDVVFDTYVDSAAQPEIWDDMLPGWRLLESEIDLRVGGTWRIVAGPPDGEPDRVTSVFTVIERPHRLVVEEAVQVGGHDSTLRTTVSLTFEEHEGGTLLRIVQTGFETAEARDGLEKGWPGFLVAFERVVADRWRTRGGGST